MKFSRGLMLVVIFALSLSACSTQQMMRVVLSKNPTMALRSIATSRINSYKYNPRLILSDLRRARNEYNRLMENVQKQSGAKWGKREAGTLPSRTRYVKYTENYKNRVVVDYDAGTILIEHLDEAGVRKKLRNAAMVALLTPGDPSAVDLFSDKDVKLNGKPYLQELVVDQNGKVIRSHADVKRYADYLVAHQLQERTIDANGVSKHVLYVKMNMVNTHMDKRALKYAKLVRKYSARTGVSRSLIYAVIKTESAFNPFAVSSAPAYGLMQLVPTSGGREAYRKVKGRDGIPSKEYLFNAEYNIELGSAYLGVLLKDTPFKYVRNPVSREYCAIAAYNTGPSNVYRAFSKLNGKARQNQALNKINWMRSDEVYNALRKKLPYAETRGYIVKVVSAKKRYVAM